ncbi:MAG: hypothetical protein ACM3X3_07635 [Betaproteobacteria bacterium]
MASGVPAQSGGETGLDIQYVGHYNNNWPQYIDAGRDVVRGGIEGHRAPRASAIASTLVLVECPDDDRGAGQANDTGASRT